MISRPFHIAAITSFLLLCLSFTAWCQQMDPTEILRNKAVNFGLNAEDTSDLEITDDYVSQEIRHTYFAQSLNGIRVLKTYGSVHQKQNVQPYSNIAFIKNLQGRNISANLRLDAEEAIQAIAQVKNYPIVGVIEVVQSPQGISQKQQLLANDISLSPIPAKLVYMPTNKSIRLAWDIAIEQVQDGFFWNFIVDAENGKLLDEISWTVSCNFDHDHSHDAHFNYKSDKSLLNYNSMGSDSSYNVYEWPLESPNFGNRSEAIKPWLDNTIASPNGWHSFGINNFQTTHGNNVDAYDDSNNTNGPNGGDADRADGGVNLDFDFPLDVNQDPANYKDAAITNLFYWNNVIHDTWYNYGFDEASGNFQEENYTASGSASDYVRAEAQDGSGTCNANFGTPSDGGNPRMQMYLCNGRDGDFDNGVIVHEYGHGISNRLTGGPSASGCLGNQEQMGEGWSDWFGMVMSIEPGDAGTDSRGMGTWLFGQGPNGNGIRPYPYSTDMNINPMTYGTIDDSGISVPHGLGSVWCTMLWDLTWALIEDYGFDPDIYNGTGGNNMAMSLVILGCKLQPCGPGFVDGRDAIIQADSMLFAGANHCLIWEVFARRGLGYSANQGSSSSRSDGEEAFDLPPSCTIALTKVVNVTSRNKGENAVFTLTATNNTDELQSNLVISDDLPEGMLFVSATNGGTESGGVVSWPSFDLAVGASQFVSFTAQVDPLLDATVQDISDDMEAGDGQWLASGFGSTSWGLQTATSNSPSNAWKANDGSSPGVAILKLAESIGVTDTTTVSFTHFYDTEATWDGGVVEISLDDGFSWIDLGNEMTLNGYNSTIFQSKPGFSGDSGGFITTEIDLSIYSSQLAQLRFVMHCDQAVGGNGWYIDDIFVNDIGYVIPNIATVSNANYTSMGRLLDPIAITVPVDALTASITATQTICYGSSDGTATVVPSAGTGSYSYNWSSGGTSNIETGLAFGTYTVTVSDGVDAISKTIQVGQPDQLDLDLVTEPSFNGNDGTAGVSVFNGLSPYFYLWSTGGTGSQITGLAPGTYNVTVTDSTPCSENGSIEVINPNNCDPGKYSTRINIQLDQYPEETSYIIRDSGNNVIGSGGTYQSLPDGSFVSDYFCLPTGCYSFEINDTYGDGICAGNSNPQGYYEVVNYDTNEVLVTGCDYGLGETVTFCVNPVQVTLNATPPTCEGDSNGSASVVASAGTGSYTYNWNTGATTSTITGLLSGTYDVTVGDGLTTAEVSVFVPQSNSIVRVTNDSGPESLRQVILDACPVDTVRIDPVLAGMNVNLTSEIVIDKDVRIKGLGLANSGISGGGVTRLFHVQTGFELYCEGITLRDGRFITNGGAIYNEGILKLKDILFFNNLEGSNTRPFSNDGEVDVVGEVTIQE